MQLMLLLQQHVNNHQSLIEYRLLRVATLLLRCCCNNHLGPVERCCWALWNVGYVSKSVLMFIKTTFKDGCRQPPEPYRI